MEGRNEEEVTRMEGHRDRDCMVEGRLRKMKKREHIMTILPTN